MSAALARFACKFSRSDSLRGGMGSRGVGEGRVLITQLMTSMSACISRDNEPNISAPSKTLLSVSTQQRKRRQLKTRLRKKKTRLSVIYRRRFSEELVDHSDGPAKKTRTKDFFPPLLSFSALSPASAEDCEDEKLFE